MEIPSELIAELERRLAPDEWTTEMEQREIHGRDETEDLRFLPDLVVRPRSLDGVVRTLELAHQFRVPVTPRGGGTGLSGGALPVHGGIVLSTDRLNRIRKIDRQDMVAVVEPGVITQTLQEEVESLGLYYPPDPASRGSCTIGGNLAENAGGPHAVKYGVTADYVMGLRAVLADGTLVNCGGACRKDVAGYDLTHLFVGSEGTLAVIVEATLRLIPKPSRRELFLAPFPTLRAGLDGVLKVLAKLTPSACEFLERAAVAAAAEHLQRPMPFPDAAAFVLMEVDGHSDAEVETQMLAAAELLEEAGAGEVAVAMTDREKEDLWALRRAAGEAVKALSIYKEEDCAVPRSRIVDLVTGVKEVADRHGITTICYGHAGDGNIHVNVLRMGMDNRTWLEVLPNVIEEIFTLTVGLGGTITGEHGVGWTQRRYLPIQFSPAELNLLRAVKRALDPVGILNPDKVLPDATAGRRPSRPSEE